MMCVTHGVHFLCNLVPACGDKTIDLVGNNVDEA